MWSWRQKLSVSPIQNAAVHPSSSYICSLVRPSDIEPSVTDLLAIFTVVYEVFSAIFTTLRSYQALRVGASGGVHTQKKGLTYLVLEQGMPFLTP